jgi:hypothetical protein
MSILQEMTKSFSAFHQMRITSNGDFALFVRSRSGMRLKCKLAPRQERFEKIVAPVHALKVC